MALLSVLLVLFGFASPTMAQQASSNDTAGTEKSGALHGVVFGPSDELPLQGATVEIDGDQRATTNADGAFRVSLAPGNHRLRLIPPGREGVDVDAVETVAGQTTEVIVEFRADGPAAVDVAAPGGKKPSDAQRSSDESEPTGEPGTLTGTVTSREDGSPVAGAQVIVRGADGETKTDEKGRFRLELPSGNWDVSVVHAQYSTGTKRDIAVKSNETTEVTWELTPAAVRLSAHTVTIPKIEGGTIAMTEKRKESTAATDVIGAEEMSKSGDSTAAGALKQVTGLTVVGGKYVYVRGLGSRYASSLLNGSTLPSPEPEKRVVPLDLFPTSMLQSVTVQKTYTPDMPGGFGGGVVRMKTREYPDEFTLELGLSTGGNTRTTFQKGLGYQGGSTDWLGVDDGTRALPSKLERATEDKALSKKDRFGRGNFTAEEIE
ncbi:MAG: carboxypeptidase regulatory-like domain-containing protein, partial [Bradymonadaceae bacterium]